MLSARIPETVWTWRRTVLVLGVVLLPALALSMAASEHDRLAAVAYLDGVILSPAALIAALACYAAWRINPRPGLAWTSFALVLLGCQGLLLAAVQLVRFPVKVQGLWVLTSYLIVVLVILFAATIGRHVRLRPDPAAAGFALGAAVAMLRLAWLDRDPGLDDQLSRPLVCGVALTAFLVTAIAVLRNRSLPRWARQRTALTVLLLGLAHLAFYLSDRPMGHLVSIAGGTAAAVLLVSTGLALFYQEVDRGERSRGRLSDDLEHNQQQLNAFRAQLHEINSTIAGIASASRLLRTTSGISEHRRTLLADMVTAEIGRLERLVAPAPNGSEPRVMALDETIGTLVVSQQARGNRVGWSPCGVYVTAQPDVVAEVLNVLLDNAAKHGRSAAEVTVTQTDEVVEVAVHDDGPGVDESLRSRLFEWGSRAPRSTGQGIGLHIAHELMERQGGYLEMRDSPTGGATFVMGLVRSRSRSGTVGSDGVPETGSG